MLLSQFVRRLLRPLRHRPAEAEIARELRDHLEGDARELEDSGVDRDSAMYLARRRFGNVGMITEQTREAWGSLWFERLSQDLQFGLRLLRRSPVFASVAVLCLALGIGANALVLSWTEGVVRHPFPGVTDQDRLVAVANTVRGASGFDEVSWPDFMDLQRGAAGFSSFFVSKITGALLTGGDRTERLVGQLVTANYFDAIGVRPILGRGFLPGEDVGRGAHPITVISYRMWRDRYRGDPRAIGSTINYNGVPHTIVGVTPEAFLGTFVGYAMQFWVPASQQAVFDASGYKLDDRSARWVEGFGRLKPGVSMAAGQAQVDALARRLEAEYPNDDRGRGFRIFALRDNPFDNAQELRPVLRAGSVVAVLVLLIVCANIANLLLVRAAARQGEIIVRQALGASGRRVMRQLITEGLLLASIGTACGIVLAYACRNALGLFFPPRGGVSLVFGADFNWRVIATACAVGMASTILFALAPALQTARADLASGIRAAAPAVKGGSGRLRSGLVLVQVALSVVLLVGAGLMITSLRRMLTADPGFSANTVATTMVNLFAAGYDTARAHRFEDDLLDRARTMSGVTSVALARSLPFSTRPYANGALEIDGYAAARDERPSADYDQVSSGYFATLGIPLLSGRDFTRSDVDTSAAVAIVSRALARRYWPGRSPIGKRIQLRGRWMDIVGVAADIKYRSLTGPPGMLVYVPLAQQQSTAINLFVRTAASPVATVAPAIVAAVRAGDPNVSPYEVLSLREQVNRSTSGQQITVTLLSIFGSVALILAVLGLYGVISYIVSQRTRELGVRMALGASPGQLRVLVMSSGLRLAAVGIGAGVAATFGTTRLLGTMLFRVSPRDPAVIGGVVVAMSIAAGIACIIPAWRASRIDPIRALRV